MSLSLAPRSRGIEVAVVARPALAALLGLGVVAAELAVRGDGRIREQVLAQLFGFACFLPAAWLCWRGLGIGRAGVGLVLLVALALTAVAFEPSGRPPLTTDLNRYAWDARVQSEGINPYRYPPSSPALERFRDEAIWPDINRKDWETVYPPGAEASFLAARVAFGPGLRATTWLFLLAEAASIGLLLLVLSRIGAPLERVALLAWHPLAVSEIAGNGHSDALAVLACSGLLAAWVTGRRSLAGIAIGAGALFKLGPVLLLVAFARGGGKRMVAAGVVTIAAGYAVYASAGTRVVGSFFRYLDREDLGSLAWSALAPLIGREEARMALAVVLLLVVGVVALREHDTVDQVARSGLLVLGSILLAAAYIQPWYTLWLLPFLVVTPGPAWLWLTGTVPLLYTFGIDGSLPSWVRTVIYVPFIALAIGGLIRRAPTTRMALHPLPDLPTIGLAIPVIDEAESLPSVLDKLPHELLANVVVVDGGSTDGTPEVAGARGVAVVVELERGYGRACRAGAEALGTDILVWIDGDGSDDPAAIAAVVHPILSGEAALSLGVRTELERGAQHWHQRLGNYVVATLVRLTTGVPLRDIPPMRAIRRDALATLDMRELTYGWPTEMVVKAARAGLPIAQVGVPSRARRGGRSKVSGRLGPSLKAGARMLGVVARYG